MEPKGETARSSNRRAAAKHFLSNISLSGELADESESQERRSPSGSRKPNKHSESTTRPRTQIRRGSDRDALSKVAKAAVAAAHGVELPIPNGKLHSPASSPQLGGRYGGSLVSLNRSSERLPAASADDLAASRNEEFSQRVTQENGGNMSTEVVEATSDGILASSSVPIVIKQQGTSGPRRRHSPLLSTTPDKYKDLLRSPGKNTASRRHYHDHHSIHHHHHHHQPHSTHMVSSPRLRNPTATKRSDALMFLSGLRLDGTIDSPAPPREEEQVRELESTSLGESYTSSCSSLGCLAAGAACLDGRPLSMTSQESDDQPPSHINMTLENDLASVGAAGSSSCSVPVGEHEDREEHRDTDTVADNMDTVPSLLRIDQRGGAPALRRQASGAKIDPPADQSLAMQRGRSLNIRPTGSARPSQLDSMPSEGLGRSASRSGRLSAPTDQYLVVPRVPAATPVAVFSVLRYKRSRPPELYALGSREIQATPQGQPLARRQSTENTKEQASEERSYVHLIKESLEDTDTESLDLLEMPHLRLGRHRTVLSLPGYKVSVLGYTRPEEFKKYTNEKFRDLHPDVMITLSKMRSLKKQMARVALSNISLVPGAYESLLEPATLSLGHIYFERLVWKGIAHKGNRRLVAAACLYLATKFYNSRVSSNFLAGLLERIEREFQVTTRDVKAAEFPVYAALEFSLHVPLNRALAVFQRLIQAEDYKERLFDPLEMRAKGLCVSRLQSLP
eukprot:comp54130_c0_seq1/m.47730 comp54130_c0_seq1/g.47730  ORF comp54130_c0_seq1/g.47730 comp54130_c0_seq1/m.47730 type:complete len:736 (-) comp54130_c0_seq1:148-2355(-)